MRNLFKYAAAAAVILGTVSGSGTFSKRWTMIAARAEDAAPKQVALTQAQIDNLIAAQKDVRAAAGDKQDSGSDPKVIAAIKKHGFDSLAQYSDVGYSIGLVMSGYDPDAKSYVGTAAVVKKQIEQVQADKSMKPQEKKEALEELNSALKQGDSEKPLPANIELVKANFDKLAETMQQGGE